MYLDDDKIAENNNKDMKKEKSVIPIIVFRWLAVVFVILFSIMVTNSTLIPKSFPYILSAAVLYNTFITYKFVKDRQKGHVLPLYVMYIDVLFLTLFSYHLGGVNSDIYILLFFLIVYCGVINNPSRTIGFSVFCVITYSISCICASKLDMGEFRLLRLIIRDFFIICTALGVLRVFYEIRKYNELRKKEFLIARTDKLTGLANRHYFDQKIKEEMHYSDYTGNHLNILMFDLDNFKRFNDTYGHIWGDKLLVLFADIIRQNIRKGDIPVRYGGEEFLILIRDLDIILAKSIGDRIRRQLEKQRIYTGTGEDRMGITVSCGIAQYPKHAKTIKQAIDCADKALYHAKETGKNKVVLYDELK